MAIQISDEVLGTYVPIIAYWVYASMYVVFAPYLEKYRLHTKEEEESLNMISRGEIIRGVLLEQVTQVIFVVLAFSGQPSVSLPQPSWTVMAMQFLVAMVVMDTYQYFVHRLLHMGFLYKYLHSKHHRLVVPNSLGALYNHPVEALLLDTFSAVTAFMVAGMTPRTSMFFLCFAGIKTVDDHCGFHIPWHPFHMLFANSSACHGVHHHLYGSKYNYSAPFFLTWDKILGTHLPHKIEKREGGGYRATIVKKNKDN